MSLRTAWDEDELKTALNVEKLRKLERENNVEEGKLIDREKVEEKTLQALERVRALLDQILTEELPRVALSWPDIGEARAWGRSQRDRICAECARLGEAFDGDK